jgi:hypothetical protein
LVCTTLDEVQRIFEEQSIDTVLPASDKENLKTRLQIIEYIANLEEYPAIHFQGRGRGIVNEPFIRAIVASTLSGE